LFPKIEERSSRNAGPEGLESIAQEPVGFEAELNGNLFI